MGTPGADAGAAPGARLRRREPRRDAGRLRHIVVVAGFARDELVIFQQMGFGVAVALLLEATVVRSPVLPGMLSLLGRRSRCLPSWLRWLPHVEVERGYEPPPGADPATAR